MLNALNHVIAVLHASRTEAIERYCCNARLSKSP